MRSQWQRQRTVLAILLIATLGSALLGCSASGGGMKPKPSVPPGGVLLQGAGATFPSVLYQKWFADYQKEHPLTVISYAAVGSGEGIHRFIGKGIKDEDKIDFGASDAAMRDEDMAKVSEGAVLLPVTAGAVALAYNLPGFDGDLKLSRQAYTAIFLGQVKNWDDPRIARTNPGIKLPHLTVTTVVRQDGSGTTFAFTKHLDSISDTWRSQYGPAILINWPGNAMRASGNEGVAGRIKQSIGSIGYVSYEFARKIGLKVASLENREGRFVAPTEKSCTSALAAAELPDNLRAYIPDPAGPDSYPIVTLTWILLYQNYPDAAKAKALHDLFRWCLMDGQKYAPEMGYVSLPPNIAMKSLARLDVLGAARP
jgi:phosphate transport system substrate-binding protein